MTRRIKALLAVTLLICVGGSVYAFYYSRDGESNPTIVTAAVTRGAIVDVVNATGAVQAVTSVQVGSQVSGTILELGADYNSIVKKGQVLARLDPSLFETQIEQARANLIRAQAAVYPVSGKSASTLQRKSASTPQHESPNTLQRQSPSTLQRKHRAPQRRKRRSTLQRSAEHSTTKRQ